MNLAYYHPIVVHFAIALTAAGVVLRWVFLTGKAKFAGPAALALILAGAAGAVIAAKSGHDAHAPIEHTPGNREVLGAHEKWGNWARNVLLGVAALELVAVIVARDREKAARAILFASGLAGLAGVGLVFLAGKEGGRLVYDHAGGIGLRNGSPEDVDRMLLTALFYKATLERQAGHREEAAILFAELGKRFGANPEVALSAAESLSVDARDYPAAVEALRKVAIPKGEWGVGFRRGWLLADALDAQGMHENALAVLKETAAALPPGSPLAGRIQRRIAAPPAGSAAPR